MTSKAGSSRSVSTRRDALLARRDELLTVEEFAMVVREHPQTVYSRLRRGEQRGAIKFGRSWRIDIHLAQEVSE